MLAVEEANTNEANVCYVHHARMLKSGDVIEYVKNTDMTSPDSMKAACEIIYSLLEKENNIKLTGDGPTGVLAVHCAKLFHGKGKQLETLIGKQIDNHFLEFDHFNKISN